VGVGGRYVGVVIVVLLSVVGPAAGTLALTDTAAAPTDAGQSRVAANATENRTYINPDPPVLQAGSDR